MTSMTVVAEGRLGRMKAAGSPRNFQEVIHASKSPLRRAFTGRLLDRSLASPPEQVTSRDRTHLKLFNPL